jgi:hypothetical protein
MAPRPIPQDRCQHCHDWGTVSDPYAPHGQEFRPCPYCQTDPNPTSHHKVLTALLPGRKTR